MLSFNTFCIINYIPSSYGDITEELNDAQKAAVDKWTKTNRAQEISSHVIPPGQDRISIPLGGGEADTAVPHPDVQQHLENNGYKISDYKAGLVQDPKYPNRSLKIGGVLQKTGASPNLMKTYQNDPARSASRVGSGGLHVVISRHPHDVAGMSTNQGWRSCMALDPRGRVGNGNDGFDTLDNAGQFSHYLKADVQHGTHVAYLAHADDPEAKNPIARIALKPFEPEDKTKSTILSPEEKIYGTSDNIFGDTVRKWAATNFPPDPNTVYNKNPKLYDDDKRSSIASSPDPLLNSKNSITRAKAFDPNQEGVTANHISRGLKDKDRKVRLAAITHANANQEHIATALKDDDGGVVTAAIQHRNASAEQVNFIVDHPNPQAKLAVAKNPNLTSDQISRLLKDKTKGDYGDLIVAQAAAEHPNLNSDHISYILKTKNSKLKHIALQHRNVSEDNINEALQDTDYVTRATAIQHRKVTTEQIHNALDDKNSDVRYNAVANRNASSDNIHKALDDKNKDVRLAAIMNENASSDNIYKALNDKNAEVRREAMVHPNATAEHIEYALNKNKNDINSEGRLSKIGFRGAYVPLEHYKAKDITAAMGNNPSTQLARVLLNHPEANATHHQIALTHPDMEIRRLAMKKLGK